MRNLFFPVFFIDILLIPFTRDQRRLGDLLAGTVVCDQRSRRDQVSDLMGLSVIVFLNLALIFSLYIFWLNFQVQQRSLVLHDVGETEISQENIVTVLEEEGQELPKFEVERFGGGLSITAEANTADQYYRVQKHLKKILEEASYIITSESDPELVFRGRESVYFQWELKAQYQERTD